MDNSMQRGRKMLGKLYGSNRPQQSEWRFGDTRMLDDSRSFKDSQIQGPSRQHGDFHMQDSRLHLESRMEPNHSPPRTSDASELQGNVRIPERVRGGSHLSREVRTHQEPRIQAGNRLQGSSRIYEDMPVQDQLKSRSNAVAYDYNHRRSDEMSPFKDIGVPSNFAANSQENIRSSRGGYHMQDDCARQGFSDILPGLPNENSGKRDLGLLLPKSYGQVSGVPPGSSHILTPSLTSSGPQTSDGVRPIGNRGSCPKKSSKAFDYLKTWRLKMNMPTDAFLLEKEGMPGNNQQSHDNVSHTHDDWYTQPPAAEPRVGRASIDPEWNYLGNSFAEKDTYGEKPNSKYGDTRTNSYGELVGVCPRGQSLENDRTGNPPWRWDEEASSGQNQGAKRNYESMASGQSFNSGHGDGRHQQRDVVQPKRQRLSPSIMQNDRREAAEQYASVISEQENLLQSNLTGTDDGRFKMNVSSGFYESQGDWKTLPFHSRPLADPSKFSRSHDSSGESVGSRHKLLPGEMKGMMARERLQTSYTHSRDVRNVSHNHPNSERSPEHLGRDRYSEPRPQERASRLVGRGQSQELHRGSMDQGRPPPSEMFMSAAPYAQEMSPRSYPRARSHRSPAKVKSPGIGARERSPALFSRRKSPAAVPREKCSESSARDRSSPWRKRRSPRPGRGRSSGPARMALPTGRGSSPVSIGRGRLSAPAGRHRSPGTEGLSGLVRRERSPEHTGRVKSPGSGRGRSPGPPRRGRSPRHQVRERSPASTRRDRSPGLPGRGRSLDHGRWKSPGRLPDHSGRGKSPEPFRKERLLGSSGRGKSPAVSGKGRSPVVPSGRGRSPGPGGQSSGRLRRGKSPGKSHAGRRGSPGSFEQGKLPSRRSPESSGRGKSPGPGRGRTSGPTGRSPGAAGSDRSLRPSGKGKQTSAPGRERSPKLLVTGKPPKTVKGESPGLVPHRSAEHQGQPRSRSQATGVDTRRRSVKGEQASSPSHLPRGRSPMKEKSPVRTRMRSESFSQGKPRPMMERAPRLRSRSPQPPVKRLVAGDRGKNETILTRECRDYRMEERERSPYLEEVSLSPRSNRFWSPSGRAVMNIRSRHSRERSQSVGALERGCSPVSVQSGDYPGVRSIYPQEPFFPERERDLQQDCSPQFYHGCSPLSVDGCSSARKKSLEVEVGSCGRQRGRFYSPSREVSFSTGRQSVEKIRGTAGNWREHDKDRGSRHFSGKKGAPVKTSDSKDATSTVGSKFVDKPEGTLLEEEVDDEDLRIHLLRLREQKVEMKLMKLEEESKETELKLWELTKSKPAPRGESPLEEERSYTEKEPYRTYGRKHESYSWKYQDSSSPAEQGRYHKQHKKY